MKIILELQKNQKNIQQDTNEYTKQLVEVILNFLKKLNENASYETTRSTPVEEATVITEMKIQDIQTKPNEQQQMGKNLYELLLKQFFNGNGMTTIERIKRQARNFNRFQNPSAAGLTPGGLPALSQLPIPKAGKFQQNNLPRAGKKAGTKGARRAKNALTGKNKTGKKKIKTNKFSKNSNKFE